MSAERISAEDRAFQFHELPERHRGVDGQVNFLWNRLGISERELSLLDSSRMGQLNPTTVDVVVEFARSLNNTGMSAEDISFVLRYGMTPEQRIATSDEPRSVLDVIRSGVWEDAETIIREACESRGAEYVTRGGGFLNASARR